MGRRSKTPRPTESVSFRRAFFVLTLLSLAAALWTVWDEAVTRRPWKRYQAEFNAILADRAEEPESIRIRQVMIPELGVVDRCESCHLGVDREGFEGEEIPQVFRTHPRRDELLGVNHPPDRFGCTPCHSGQGPQTKGVGWHAFDHGRNDPYWERPMHTGAFAESQCATCHARQDPIPGAQTFARGARLYESLRCSGCHASPLVDAVPAPGIPFAELRAKLSRGYVTAYLRDRSSFRSDLRMPEFWPDPGDAVNRTAWTRARDDEIEAIAAFIGSVGSDDPPDDQLPDDLADPARVERGRALFDQVGCRGCHSVEPIEGAPDRAEPPFGTNLGRVSERASAAWLAAWLRGPEQRWPGTRMPDLRLVDDERFDLVAYLVTLHAPDATPVESRWPDAADDLVDAGRELVNQYGCYGCHAVPGFENAGSVGADLDDFGDKPPELLAWGDGLVSCDRPALECWTLRKLAAPRSLTGADLILTMPDYGLSESDTEALAVFVLGHRDSPVPDAYVPDVSDDERALQQGERLVARRNCRGCHEIGRNEVPVMWDGEVVDVDFEPLGGDILGYYDDPTLGPPPLTFAGAKLQYDWIFEFLSRPTRIRPWLTIRHPTFEWTDEEKQTVIRFFAARNDVPYPFVVDERPTLAAADRDEAVAMFEQLRCVNCHMLSSASELAPGELAPDLALTPSRVRSDWLRDWLRDPQYLQPGTRMPTYFPLMDENDPHSAFSTCPQFLDGDVDRQIDALVALTFEFARGTVRFGGADGAAEQDDSSR